MIRKRPDGQWLVDVQPGGRSGKRLKRVFQTQAEAKRFQHHIEAQAIQQPWNPRPRDRRKLSELVEAWHQAHGQHLAAGENTRSRLIHFAQQIGDPNGKDVTPKLFAAWRTAAMARTEQPMKAGGVNRILAYLKAMFSRLQALGDWHDENPLDRVSPIRSRAPELRYLSAAEIRKLLDQLDSSTNESARLCAIVALSTGARWSEAETLTRSQIADDAIRYHTQKDSGGGKWRTVPIETKLQQALTNLEPIDGDRLFAPCYAAFREAVGRAKIKLPDGQLTHVLRHTFATTFLAAGGDLRTLKDLLGHESIQMTMRYAHLVETHLTQARTLNPIAIHGIEIASEVRRNPKKKGSRHKP